MGEGKGLRGGEGKEGKKIGKGRGKPGPTFTRHHC